MNLTDPPSLGLIGSQFSIVQPLPSFTLCRQRLILSTPPWCVKKRFKYGRRYFVYFLSFLILCLAELHRGIVCASISKECLFFFLFLFFLFFPFLFFIAISRCISSAMILLPSDNKKMLIKGSDITE